MKQVIAALNEALERNEPVALATVVQVQGASPAQLGFKLLVWLDGRTVGNVGGGALELQVREAALFALHEGHSRLFHAALPATGPESQAVPCGGEVTLFIEVYNPVPSLLIVGGGHLGQPLAEMARLVGFRVQVVDIEPERATEPLLDPAAITAWTYVVIVSRTHATDEQALRQVLDRPAAYVGMIGSQSKVQTIFGHLRADGVPEEKLARVHAPIGLDLGGRSPQEIALAILAELVQVRYGGTGRRRTQAVGSDANG